MADYRIREEDNPIPLTGSTAAKIIAGVIIFFGLLTMWLGAYRVDQYERGIITRNGAFLRIAEPGLGFMIPWIDSITHMDMREVNPKFSNMEMYSADQQPATINASIVLSPRLDKLVELYTKYRTVDNAIHVVVAPVMPTEIKIVFGRYTASEAIQKRDKLNIDAKEAILTALGSNSIFSVVRVPIENIEFSKEYVKSVESRMQAEVEVLKIKQQWEQEKLKADIVKTQADAQAYQVEVKGKAEAGAIDMMGQALAKNPKYVDKLTAERWDGKLPITMVPNGSIPFVNVVPKQ